MMRKTMLLMMLILVLALPASLAEETVVYTPGAATENLFAEAFARGEMLSLDMQFDLALSENANEIFGEDVGMLLAVSEMLKNTKLTIGAGKIDSGIRVILAGDYTADSGNAAINAALDLTYDGLALTGSFLSGEVLTAKWETLLSLCGLSDEEMAAILSLRDADLAVLLAELMQQIAPMLEMAAQIAAPYGETILTHIAGLPMVINENVPAEYGYPAAASEMQIQVTAKAVGDLVVALASQLKQDATLCALLDMVLAESAETEGMTTAQLCDAVTEAAQEELTDETKPLNIFIGMDAAGNVLYLNIIAENEDGTYFTVNYIGGQLEESDASLINIDVLTLTAEQDILDGFSFVLAYDIDDANSNIMSMEMLLGGYVDGAEILSLTLYTDNAAADFEGISGYAGILTMALNALDGETTANVSMNADLAALPSSNGGEEISLAGSMTIAAEGEEIPLTFDAGLLTEGATAVMTEAVQLPDFGIAEWRETYTLTAAAQEPAAEATVLALETASPEALEAMAGRAVSALEQTISALLELLLSG